MSDTSRTAEKQEPAFRVGDAVTVNGTAMTVIAIGVTEKPTDAEANAERIEVIVEYGKHYGWKPREIARTIVEAFPELRADNFAGGPARYKDGSLIEPYQLRSRPKNIPVPK